MILNQSAGYGSVQLFDAREWEQETVAIKETSNQWKSWEATLEICLDQGQSVPGRESCIASENEVILCWE